MRGLAAARRNRPVFSAEQNFKTEAHWQRRTPWLQKMPSALTVTFVQSSVLNAISNILAQLIDQRNNTVIPPSPLSPFQSHPIQSAFPESKAKQS